MDLTNRQEEIVKLICEGMSNKQIAFKLNLKGSTIKTHLERIMERTGCNNRTQLAVEYLRRV
jgi:DNA-binding NarL/FixJ family response regulator